MRTFPTLKKGGGEEGFYNKNKELLSVRETSLTPSSAKRDLKKCLPKNVAHHIPQSLHIPLAKTAAIKKNPFSCKIPV